MITRTNDITGDATRDLPSDLVFFDIETTGLSYRNSHLYMIGLLYADDAGKWTLTQWLGGPTEEQEMLGMLSAFLCGRAATLVHYNGDGFDLPYLRKKYSFYGLADPTEDPASVSASFDLYRCIRPYGQLLGLSSLRQKDLEALLDLKRTDPYGGGELIPLYQEYLGSLDGSIEDALFLHNFEDVANLPALYALRAYAELFEARGALTFSEDPVRTEPPCGNAKKAAELRLCMELSLPLPLPLTLQTELATLHAAGREIILAIPGREGPLRYFFEDYQNYYYLPEEDMAIHKSVGASVDRAHREQARASNCYQYADGLFYPQLRPVFSPVFYEEYRAKPAYFRLADLSWPPKKELLRKYMRDLLSTFLSKNR